ncbi:general stress protein [Microbacterium sp. YY-01]|uniref:general stress protein n=1 Tax=Microbacterium sp. YY-01 TaxID=3421634 RepID=UPI003D172F0F
MSMQNRMGSIGEVGQTVAEVREYEAAQKIVSQLIEHEVPAREITIVGIGVRTIERVTGKLGYATAARSGAINGILIGLLLAAIFVLGNPDAQMQVFVGVLFVGIAMGMILSLISYAIVRRRRDYASVTQLAADHYEVKVLPSSLTSARQALGAAAAAARPAPTPVNWNEPPQYGERLPQHQPASDQTFPQPPPTHPATPPVEPSSTTPAGAEPVGAEPTGVEPGSEASQDAESGEGEKP